MANTVDVKREGGKAKMVSINTGNVIISFCFREGKVLETSRVRIDGARISRESLWIAPVLYNSSLNTARAIFKEKIRGS